MNLSLIIFPFVFFNNRQLIMDTTMGVLRTISDENHIRFGT